METNYPVNYDRLYMFMSRYMYCYMPEQVDNLIEYVSKLWDEPIENVINYYLPLAVQQMDLERWSQSERERRYQDRLECAIKKGSDLVEVQKGAHKVILDYNKRVRKWLFDRIYITIDGVGRRRGSTRQGAALLRTETLHPAFGESEEWREKTVEALCFLLTDSAMRICMNGCLLEQTLPHIVKELAKSAKITVQSHIDDLTRRRQASLEAQGLRSKLSEPQNIVQWSDIEMIKVGSLLMDAIRSITYRDNLPLFKRVATKDRHAILELHPAVKQKISDYELRDLQTHPIFQPMRVPPQNWTSLNEGGYWYITMPLFKQSTHRDVEDLVKNKWDDVDKLWVYDTINLAQRTQWEINPYIFRVQNALLGSGLAGLPDETKLKARVESELGVAPWKLEQFSSYEDAFEHNPDAIREYCHKKRHIVQQYYKEKQKAEKARDRQKVGLRFLQRTQNYPLHFSYYYDWRGRLYPRSLYLHPQESKDGRGLLQFADGHTLTENNAEYWFHVGFANAMGNGFDKLSFDDRCDKVMSMHQQIIRAYNESLTHDFRFDKRGPDSWWMDSDDPFRTLSFIHEYVGYWSDPENFKSHLPIHLDGSCNALQWLSALCGDPFIGELVNLIPSNSPNDYYGFMSDYAVQENERIINDGPDLTAESDAWEFQKHLEMVRDLIEQKRGNRKVLSNLRWTRDQLESCISDAEFRMIKYDCALAWKDKLNRSIIKTGIMTDNYNSTFFRQKEYIEEKLTKLDWDLPSGTRYLNGDVISNKDAAMYLEKMLWKKLKEVSPFLAGLKKWFEDVALIFAKEHKYLQWTTPIGFTVVQAKFKQTTEGIEQSLGSRKAITYTYDTDEISPIKMKNGFSPNFIHSLDSSHLSAIVIKCAQEGIKNFSLIHDSIGVPAHQIETLRQIIWSTFCKIIDTDPLKRLRDELQDQVETPLPELPERGELILNPELMPEYVFS